jgi:hypothetical protein
MSEKNRELYNALPYHIREICSQVQLEYQIRDLQIERQRAIKHHKSHVTCAHHQARQTRPAAVLDASVAAASTRAPPESVRCIDSRSHLSHDTHHTCA